MSSNISSVGPCTWPWPCRTRLSPRRTSSGTQPSDRRRLRPTWQQQQVCTQLNFLGGNVKKFLLKFGPSEGHLQPRNKPTMFHQYERRLHANKISMILNVSLKLKFATKIELD